MAKVGSELLRVNLNLPRQMVESVREYASSRGITYTQAYIMLISKGLDQDYAMITLTALAKEIEANKNK